MIHIIAVDDHTSILVGLESAIRPHADMQLVATADHGSKVIDLVAEHHPHIVILDLGVSDGPFDPVETVRTLKKRFPDVKVLIFTNYAIGVWARALVKAGISGYLLKTDSFQSLEQAIRKLFAGGRYFSAQISGELIGHDKGRVNLTRRERHILAFFAEGKSKDVAAENLGISEPRVRNLQGTICDKLEIEKGAGLSRMIAAVNKARQLGWLPNQDMTPNLVELLSSVEDDDSP